MSEASTVPEVFFNPFEPDFFDNPYEQYALLRDADPVHHTPLDVWMLFRYDDCFETLRDASLSVDANKSVELNTGARQERINQIREIFPEAQDSERRDHSILMIDPPDHTRLRRLMSKVFTPRRVEALRPRVQYLVDQELQRVGPAGEMDVIADLAFPLPFAVISEMLGMPDGDRDQLRDWSHAAVKLLDPIMSDDELRTAAAAGMAMTEYCGEVVDWKRNNLGDDLLSALITAEDEGDVLSDDELIDQVVLLFIAGHETTVNLIGNGVYRLLQNRDQLEILCDDATLDQNAVEELLRFDSPVQFSRRVTLVDIEIGGREIEAGSFMMTCLGSANHDPSRFGVDAGSLDLRREGANRHLSFGSGIHHCLGAALARLEGQVAIPAVVRRFRDLELAGNSAAWNGRIVLRGLDTLPVVFTPGAG